MTAAQSVSVVRFRAGDLSLAIAASAVANISAPRASAPHVASLLGADRCADREQRLLRIATDGVETDLRVDAPVELDEISAGEILPAASGFSSAVMEPFVGIAGKGEELVLLIAASSLLRLLGH